MKRNTTPVVDAITEMNHAGNIVNPLWIRWIKEHNPDEKAESKSMACTAALVLSDILYWYRASVIRDETTGAILEIKKRFKADKLQRSYDAIADQWGISKRQAQRAVYLLRDVGLITVETRTITSQGIRIPNVVFMEPVPENVIKAGQMSGQNRTEDTPKTENGHTKKGKTSNQKRSDKYIDYSESSTESTHSLTTTTTERPKKKASSSSERERDASLLDSNAQEVAEYVASECYYQGDDGEIYPYRKTKALVRACEGHTKESAYKAVVSTWEFMESERGKGKKIGSPQAVICTALTDRHQPSAQYEAEHDKTVAASRERTQHQQRIEQVKTWAMLAQEAGYIDHVQEDKDNTWVCVPMDNPTVLLRMKLWEIPEDYAHLTIESLNHELDEQFYATEVSA